MKPVVTVTILALLLVITAVVAVNLRNTTSLSSKASLTEGVKYTQSQMDTYGLTLDPIECPSAYKVKGLRNSSGKPICTHGPEIDPARFPASKQETLAEFKADIANYTIPCDGDGQSGNRVQVLYVRASDIPDHYTSYWINLYKIWSKAANKLFVDSAGQTGGYRAIRFVHDSNCDPIVNEVVIGPEDDQDFSTIKDALIRQGYNRTDRKYLIYADVPFGCGQGTISNDDVPSDINWNNSGPDWAMVFKRCWYEDDALRTGDVAAHEISHNLGAVQLSAPHTSNGWHCVDEHDNLCYSDQPNYPPMEYKCGENNQFLLDCNHDDYFHTNPESGNYLQNHWNVANSSFLIRNQNPQPSPSPSPNPSPNPSPTPTTNYPLKVRVLNKATGQKYGGNLTIRASYMSSCTQGCNSSCTDPVCTLGREKPYTPTGCNNIGCATWASSVNNGKYTMSITNLPAGWIITSNGCSNWTSTQANGRTCTITVEKPLPKVQGYLFRDDYNHNGIKNSETNEPSIPGLQIRLFRVDATGSIVVASTFSSVSFGGNNFSFDNIPAGNYQFNRVALPKSLAFENCDSITPPTSIPTSGYFYCQSLNDAGTKYRLLVKKWSPGSKRGFVNVGKIFTVTSEGAKVDIPVVSKSSGYRELEYE